MNTAEEFSNKTEANIIPKTSGNIQKKLYLSVRTKFVICHILSIIWICFSAYLSIPWILDLSKVFTLPVALIIIAGVAYIPGYFNAFMVTSLFFDKQPPAKNEYPTTDVTVLIAARNEANRIGDTLKYVANQDYTGNIKVVVIDNGSTDGTDAIAYQDGKKLNIDLTVIREENPGKFNALNKGLKFTETDLVITLDADTLLHKSAIRYIVSRIESSSEDVCAVAGSMLVRNSRDNIKTKMQEWDYFLGIASIKRLQGLYQGTLVAQGAYSIYKTKNIIEVGGWPDAIGEDIVLTWNLLKKGWKTYFEPLAVAFTDVPDNWHAFGRQRSRWARGMIEALKQIKPWQQPQGYTKYMTGVNLMMPYLDFAYTLCWLPGLILACFGIYWLIGLMTLLVLPLTLIGYTLLYMYQRHVFKLLKLHVRDNIVGFILFVLFNQMIMSPVSVWGYLQELFNTKRNWK